MSEVIPLPVARRTLRERATRFWLGALFFVARTQPRVLNVLRPLVCLAVPLVSRRVRTNTRLNGRRINRDGSMRFARAVVGAFYDFICDVAFSTSLSPTELRSHIVNIEGADAYRLSRHPDAPDTQRRGAVLVTAHMGSFEVGLVALTEVERSIHVLYKRDALDGFEQMRHGLRDRLGVTECAIDDGWQTLVKLRDALARDEVVVVQVDRVMPRQKSHTVRVCHGSLRLPVGPVTLARINRSLIVPVFTVREARGKFRVFIEPPIDPDAPDAKDQIGRTLERFIAKYPEQWLVLDAAFVEDEGCGVRA